MENNSRKTGLDAPIFKDARGEIRRFELDLPDGGVIKFNALFTKAGVLRSGDFHPNRQLDIVLSGKVKVRLMEDGHEREVELGPNDFLVIPPNVPHIFEFLEPTWMLEWWDGPFEATYYKPYRDLVEASYQR